MGIIARNSNNVAPVVFATQFIGCPLNTFDPTFGKNEFIHMAKTTKPCLIFCDVDVYELVVQCYLELGINVKIFTFGGEKGNSTSVERLFVETGDENRFL